MANDTSGDAGMDEWAAALAEQVSTEQAAMDGNYERAQFQELREESPVGKGNEINIDSILDVPVTLSL